MHASKSKQKANGKDGSIKILVCYIGKTYKIFCFMLRIVILASTQCITYTMQVITHNVDKDDFDHHITSALS